MNVEATIFFDLLLLALHRNDDKVKALTLELFELFEKNMQFVSDSDVKYINLYSAIIKEVIGNRLIYERNKNAVMSIIRKYLNNKSFDREKAFKDGLYAAVEEEMSTDRITSISARLNNFVLWNRSNAFVKSMYGNLRECAISFDVEEQSSSLGKVQSIIGEFQRTIADLNSTIGDGTSIEKIDLTNKADIERAFTTFKERKVTSILKTGLKGLNRMFGPRLGMALGESIIFCALPHNYKSMMLLSMANWIVKYSTPPKGSAKNLILFISLENEAYENMMLLFERVYVVLTGQRPENVSDKDIITYIHDYFSKCGYTLVVERYLPDQFGFEELMALVERYENSGYKVVSTIIDYLSQMKKGDGLSSKVGNHLLIKVLYNKVCNYMKAKGVTMLSAHQLNRKAAELVSSGVPNPVKRFNTDHFADSMDPEREVDMVVYQHIERNDDGEAFLTLSWGKHRYVNDTAQVDKYCAYKFHGDLGIMDDLDSEDNGFTRNIFAGKGKGDVSSSDVDELF